MRPLGEGDQLASWLGKLSTNAPASEVDIERLRRFGPLPQDYVELMRRANGAAGPIGNSYLIIYPTETARRLNEMRKADIEEMGERTGYFFIFGSNGGGASYAFDMRQLAEEIVEVDSLDLGFEEPVMRGRSLIEFFEYLSSRP